MTTGKFYPPQGFPKPYEVLTQNVGSYSNNQEAFWSINSHGNLAGTESDRTIATDVAMILRRLRINPAANGKDEDITAAFRDDGSSVGAVTVPAGSTVKVDSGALNVKMAKGSLMCFLIDTSASSAGSFQSLPMKMVARITG